MDGAGPALQQAAPDTVLLTNWKIRNTGTCVWDPSYRLAFLGGERLSGPRALYLRDTVSPGGEVTMTVRIIAPAVGGSYQGRWQLFAPDGTPFGGMATVDIVVPFDESTALRPDQIAAKVSTGSHPTRVALGDGAAWVTNESGGTVSRIDLDTNQVVATVPVGNSPRPVAAGYGAVWVGNLGDGTVSRIDPATNTVTATIPLDPSPQPFGSQPSGIAAGAGAVWVASGVTGADSGKIDRIDPTTNQVVATIEVERWPSQVVALDDVVWISHSVTPFLTRIDPATNEISATLNLECPTMGLAADATGVWAACVGVPVLLRIDPLTNQVAARIAIGPRSEDVALGPNGVWVTSGPENTLTLIDPDTNLAVRVYSVGRGPKGVAVSQDEVWVVLSGEDAVWRLRP
jgi:YVTN family beta-propeller protein